jgi:uncharacterized protein (TIRG00374 family)
MPSFRDADREDLRSNANGEVAAGGPEGPLVPAAPDDDNAEPSFFQDPRRLILTGAVVLLMFGAIYVALPNVIGLEDAIAKIGEGEWQWFVVALGFNVAAFAAYVALFRGVIGENLVHLDWRESYQITMAGLAASRLLSAGGAGGVVLSYWALRKAGMKRSEAARRMVAFLVVLYSVYVFAVILFGVLLRTGVLPGEAPVSVTIVPAAIAGGIALIVILFALIPGDLPGRLTFSGDSRVLRLIASLSAVPATIATGTRTALGFIRNPRKGGLAVAGAVGFWAANIGILWASFMAFDESVPIGVIVMGFFVGMAANIAPDPAGVGAVDGGLIGAFVIFGLPASTVIAAVLIYRLIAFWLPLPPGIVAFLQLRRTVARWEDEGRPAIESREDGPDLQPAGPSNTSESKVSLEQA